MLLFVIAVIVFIIADILIRLISRRIQENKVRKERESALAESVQLDFTREAKSLKRAEVEHPKARILCVDDEEVILDSFRKILVLDGYSVDTVQTGQEALGLLQTHHYDFVFTDLKMPAMSGVEVTKSVKHVRPDIDVVIITGFATVETAVECMKYGAMDYVQKPFTEDELLAFVKKALIKRQDRIQKQLKPRVHITHVSAVSQTGSAEFAIPGGVFISESHCWAAMFEDGSVRVGIDDFANKLLGRIDALELPNLGMTVNRGQPLFTVSQKGRHIPFLSPVSGKVIDTNTGLAKHVDELEHSPYADNWICVIDADKLDAEIPSLKIGNAAVAFYQEELENFKTMTKKMSRRSPDGTTSQVSEEMYTGEMQDLDDRDFDTLVAAFFRH
ncbi:MAG: sigma-54 dependent DNA-binding response regulator [Bacteroidetes bacterium]|jgi:CheY-like chemotaxis protein/glycine cleavage system H lipoate-binding protein|nr:sigma-54 dependent DNA-binding response regulator [Bacteroidota bacterium]